MARQKASLLPLYRFITTKQICYPTTMIRLLEGTVRDTTAQSLTLMCGGVGYLVFVPNPGVHNTGDTLTLHTHHAVRETALDLYGFSSSLDLTMFELLLKVPKIGPKSALGVMVNATTPLLAEAITREDPAHLQKLSGIGKKTCENIVANLHGKLPPELEAAEITDGSKVSTINTDAVDALISLGYAPQVARDSIAAITEDSSDLSVNELVTKALKGIQ